ncbi:alginate lyase family protein [Microbulbifer thermotolerans]|uniref:alginate lyase family protein n=1 Tax=Microbulbifer thermotolerans TaxID=252514 RepID=UPI00224AB3DC|nr:alginate lyase family protein [Microbulbifer thermotolerans]MCX2840249.1 alginate lyase family protein [Microbulbifer thermotolerans]
MNFYIKAALRKIIKRLSAMTLLQKNIKENRESKNVYFHAEKEIKDKLSKKKQEYFSARHVNLDQKRSKFILYRIIGNDLYPRHGKGQSKENLKFILENEPDLVDCEKRFVINRIVDPESERAIIELLEQYKISYIHIPFDLQEYRNIEWDIYGVPVQYAPYSAKFRRLPPFSQMQVLLRTYRHKNNYVMNNNGARNFALREGKNLAEWVLPWDGNCFITDLAWEEIRNGVESKPHIPYHFVPMARMTNNKDLLKSNFAPDATEEPQIIFKANSLEEFNPEYFYGRRPKVELFWRLGFPGKWDYWPIEPWDLPYPKTSKDVGCYAVTGWVARLFSGKIDLEKKSDQESSVNRAEARTKAITAMLNTLDSKVFDKHLDQKKLLFTKIKDISNPSSLIFNQLKSSLRLSTERFPFYFLNSEALIGGTSRDSTEYFVSHFVENSFKEMASSFFRKVKFRKFYIASYQAINDQSRQSFWQNILFDIYIFVLGWLIFNNKEDAEKAAKLVLDTLILLEPWKNSKRGLNRFTVKSKNTWDVSDFNDIYYLLDAIRILKKDGFLSKDEIIKFENWIGSYLYWLTDSEQGTIECASRSFRGTYYDFQVSAICVFLGEGKLLRETLRNSRFRILEQFSEDGSQTSEISRFSSIHHYCLNLQGWLNLARIAESAEEDLWNFSGVAGNGIRKGVEWLIKHGKKSLAHPKSEYFDYDRLLPIFYTYKEIYKNGIVNLEVPAPENIKAIFYPTYGILPFWNLKFLSVPKVDNKLKENVY